MTVRRVSGRPAPSRRSRIQGDLYCADEVLAELGRRGEAIRRPNQKNGYAQGIVLERALRYYFEHWSDEPSQD